MANLFKTKPLAKLMHEAQEVGEHSLKRSLGPVNLIALGIGGIIGAGLFVRTAAAIAERLEAMRRQGLWHPRRNDVDIGLAALRGGHGREAI